MRRFCKRGLPVGLFLLVTFFYPLLAPPAHRIDEAHFEKISVGMSLEDVESRFGAPAGSYDWAVQKSITLWDVSGNLAITDILFVSDVVVSRPSKHAVVWDLSNTQISKFDGTSAPWTVNYLSTNSRTWTSRHGTCTIHFDANDRVAGKSGWGETRLEPPWHNWRKWFSK